jgi:benzodiazapine receptor
MVHPSPSGIAAPTRIWVGLLFSLAVTALAATLGAAASVNAKDFYGLLAKPEWAPSPRVFGPVWTVLYILMAIAAWLVWRTAGLRAAMTPLALYGLQLLLNALWTWIFFRWRSGAWALLDISALCLILLLMLVGFWRIRVAAGVLLLPYLAWVLFATALTAAVWRRNPSLL